MYIDIICYRKVKFASQVKYTVKPFVHLGPKHWVINIY